MGADLTACAEEPLSSEPNVTVKEESASDPPAVTVDDRTESAAYQGLGKMKVDTTDDGWGQGVFGDQEDTTQPPIPERQRDGSEDELRKITRSVRLLPADDVEEEPQSLMVPALIAGAGVGLVGALAVWVLG